MFNNIIKKLGTTWSTILVSILCIIASVVISFVVGSLVGSEDLASVLIAAVVCPTLIAPPVIHFYASLALSLEDSRQEQENLNKNLTVLNHDLTDALKKVKLLSGMLPICSVCKKIRDDRGYWNKVESYIKERSNADFVRGLCPECVRLYPDMAEPGESTDDDT